MTRWAEDDLAGRLISELDAGGEQWVILSLPAIAEENDMPWPVYRGAVVARTFRVGRAAND